MSAQGHLSFSVVVTAENNDSQRERVQKNEEARCPFSRAPSTPHSSSGAKDGALSPPAADNMCDPSSTWDAL